MWSSQPVPGDGWIVPHVKQNRPVEPQPDRRHQWVATAIFGVSHAAMERCAQAWFHGGPPEGIDLDNENLITVQGPTCLKCGEGITPLNTHEACPVVIMPRNGNGPDAETPGPSVR